LQITTTRAWLHRGLKAQSAALNAKTVAERQRHALDSFDSFMAAASDGENDVLLSIGVDYQTGAYGIIPARSDLAEHWLRLAAARDPSAILAMGTFLMERGRKAEARRWFRKALARGDGGAACHLGYELEREHPARALRWYLKGVALGEPFAAVCAGRVLEARGTRKDLLRAEAMYEKAARERFMDSARDLARVRRKLSGTN
jgi:TPR repeat protein